MGTLRTAEYRVTMDDLQRLLGGEGGVDLVPIVENGKQVAMRIVGVTENTTAARLGARTGDTIETINNMRLTSIAEAYRVGDRVLREQRIVIAGKRDEEPYATTLVLG